MAKKIAVIGAGLAGIMAAYTAAKKGADVSLYEKNPMIGRKLIYVPWDTCHLTHTGGINDFVENYSRGAEFMRHSLEKFGFKKAMKFFEELGVDTETDDNGAVSPSNEPSELQKALDKKLRDLGVRIYLSSKIQDIIKDGKKVKGIKVHNQIKEYDKIIIATGGLARPKLGASEDGYRFAEKLGHTIIEPKPSNSEIDTEDKIGKYLRGMRVSPVRIGVYQNHKKIIERNGEVIFTIHGLAGDTILFLSGTIARLMDKGKVEISIDLVPDKPRELLERELRAKSSNLNHYLVGEVLGNYIDKRIVPILTRFTRIRDNKPMNHITNLERKGLLLFMKDFRVTVKRVKPFYAALYTSGGIDVMEVNPKSMESKLVKGLYFCGEVLDIESGPGGYNLHSAWATGFSAGNAASRGAKKTKAVTKKAKGKVKKLTKNVSKGGKVKDDTSSIAVA